ncbi:Protein BIG GRAIN 1-like A [Euphorbia peplus]|nr:Protein BIG GRAIN 1-like A [Euphorbia peplus]
MNNKWENHHTHTHTYKKQQPTTFSSTLLDQIYRSISEPDNIQDLKFYTNPIMHTNKTTLQHQHSIIPKCIDHTNIQQLQKSRYHDPQDAIFFSSTSISSDSSSGAFSSSDTDSIYNAKPKSSSSASVLPIRPKPVRTSVSGKTDSRREFEMLGHYGHNETPKLSGKSRALKMYNKVKQPVSPGGKLANFINSIFTNGNSKKKSNPCSVDQERTIKSGQASTCSSASSFSRSCWSKSDKFRDGVKRNVRFYPVSVILDEPCRHKSLYEDEESSRLMSVSMPTAWKIGKSPSKKIDNEFKKYQVMDKKSRRVARDFLISEYQKKKKNENHHFDEHEDDFDDDASYSSSDLFELDHLSVFGKDMYSEELPVYETTTPLHTNRPIYT